MHLVVSDDEGRAGSEVGLMEVLLDVQRRASQRAVVCSKLWCVYNQLAGCHPGADWVRK
jgi:hypothetical protein